MADLLSTLNIVAAFAKKWEAGSSNPPTDDGGLNYIAFDDGFGTPTIGWGSTYYKDNSPVKMGDVIPVPVGDDLFIWELSGKESLIRSFVPWQNLSNNQYAALIDLAYEGGQGAVINNSNLIYALNTGNYSQAADYIAEAPPLTANGIFVQGIKNRRVDESMLFSGKYNSLYSFYLRNQATVNTVASGLGVAIAAGVISFLFIRHIRKNKKK